MSRSDDPLDAIYSPPTERAEWQPTAPADWSIGDAFRSAIRDVRRVPLVVLVLGLLPVAWGVVGDLSVDFIDARSAASAASDLDAAAIIGTLLSLGGLVAHSLWWALLAGGLAFCELGIARGGGIEFGAFPRGARRVIPVFVVTTVPVLPMLGVLPLLTQTPLWSDPDTTRLALFVLGGLVLVVVSFYVMFRWSLGTFAVVDGTGRLGDSIGATWRLTGEHQAQYAWLCLLMVVLEVPTMVGRTLDAPLVGYAINVFLQPIQSLTWAHAYLGMSTSIPFTAQEPPPTPASSTPATE